MANTPNMFVIGGNVGGAVELRTAKSGSNFATFSLAHNEPDHMERGKYTTTWYRVTVPREQLSKLVTEHVKSGTNVTVMGRLLPREFEAADGTKKTSLDIVADQVCWTSNGSSGSKPSADDEDDEDTSTDGIPF